MFFCLEGLSEIAESVVFLEKRTGEKKYCGDIFKSVG